MHTQNVDKDMTNAMYTADNINYAKCQNTKQQYVAMG